MYNMKRNFIYLLLFIVLCGCKEEFIGQYPVDKVAPGEVTNVSVENIPGGARISYTLPEEKDLLCVKARYTLTNGQEMEQSGSAYVNRITLKGFGKGAKTKIELVTIDKSHNESKVVSVDIEPLDSPIYGIMESLKYYASFGGLKLLWENAEKEDIVFGLLTKDEEGAYKETSTIYSSTANVNTSARGYEAKEIAFGFYIRDTYNNHTDTIYDVLTPYFETELDKSKFRVLPLPTGVAYRDPATNAMPLLWNGRSNVLYETFYIKLGEVDPFFSFDMGVTAKLSRFRLWQRMDLLFQFYNPRYFEIWGTNDESKVGDPDNWDGWFKIMNCESKRPSGLGVPTSDADLTQEDIDYALAGEEYEIPIDAPAFRYFRMYVYNPYNPLIGGTWGGSKALHLEEITIWGAPENE
ncbi:hypothetical protein FACS189430_00030 [Bacteroidia bacterium]|nr:hypothetical protein FACS189430_00030 [Bacteroidia bacterium]